MQRWGMMINFLIMPHPKFLILPPTAYLSYVTSGMKGRKVDGTQLAWLVYYRIRVTEMSKAYFCKRPLLLQIKFYSPSKLDATAPKKKIASSDEQLEHMRTIN